MAQVSVSRDGEKVTIRILDIGCRVGLFLLTTQGLPGSILGIDVEQLMEEAKTTRSGSVRLRY